MLLEVITNQDIAEKLDRLFLVLLVFFFGGCVITWFSACWVYVCIKEELNKRGK